MATTKAKKKPEPAKKATKAKGTTKAKPAAKKTAAKPKKTTATKSKAAVAHPHPVKHKAPAKKKAAMPHAKEAKFGMDENQKADLLQLINQIVHHRLNKPGGLRSFFMINRILDFHNQKYTHPETKFDAIVAYGAKKHRGVEGAEVYIIVNAHEKDETELYKLLAEVEKNKMKYDDVKSKLEVIASESETQQ